MNQNRPTQEMIEEGYKQARLNARQIAITSALQARTIGFDSHDAATGLAEKKAYTAAELVADAKKVEEYLMDGIEPPKAPSSIMKATVGPGH